MDQACFNSLRDITWNMVTRGISRKKSLTTRKAKCFARISFLFPGEKVNQTIDVSYHERKRSSIGFCPPEQNHCTKSCVCDRESVRFSVLHICRRPSVLLRRKRILSRWPCKWSKIAEGLDVDFNIFYCSLTVSFC